jgi:hypothetical protein
MNVLDLPDTWTRRAARQVDRLSRAVGIDPLAGLTPERVVRTARRRTGLDDLGDDPYPDGLAVACRALRDEAALSVVGAAVMSDMLVRNTMARLRLVEARKRFPERFSVPLRPPIVVFGLPRSGTTALSRVLTGSPHVRWLPSWECGDPIHLGGVDDRRFYWGLGIRFLVAMAPELANKHVFDVDTHEEEVGLFSSTGGYWLTPWRLAHVPSYLRWLMAQDARAAYRDFADILRWLQRDDRPLVLKLPNHLGCIDALLEAVPDAVLVRTHRDPARIVPSYASLGQSMWRVASFADHDRSLGEGSLWLWATHHARFEAVRSGVDVLELPFARVREDMLGCIEAIHQRAGLPWDEAAIAASTAAMNVQAHAQGKHVYDAATFGLTDEGIRAAFG